MKVLVTDRYSTECLRPLKEELDAQVIRTTSHQPTAMELDGAEAMLIRSRTRVDQKLISKAKNLKYVLTSTSGFDHIDLKACQEANIQVSYTPEANAQSAAELALFMTLGALRALPKVETVKSQGQWKESLQPGQELFGKCVGIIGLGRVGRAFSHLLSGFKCRILVYDPYLESDMVREFHGEKTSLLEVLKQANVLSLHVPLTGETRGLISKNNLAEMSTEAILINCSRGAVVNEQDLLEALDQDQLRGAALDVFQHEPLKEDSKIRRHPKIFWTPHIGALTEEALEQSNLEAVRKLIQFTQGAPVEDILPGQVPWLKAFNPGRDLCPEL